MLYCLSFFQYTVYHEAWPLRIHPKQPHEYVSSRCSRDKSIPKTFSEENSMIPSSLSPVGTGLISGWVTISIKYPVLYSLGSQTGVVDINHAFHVYYNVVCGSSFSRSQPDFEGFLRALLFPPSAKLTPSLIQYVGPH